MEALQFGMFVRPKVPREGKGRLASCFCLFSTSSLHQTLPHVAC